MRFSIFPFTILSGTPSLVQEPILSFNHGVLDSVRALKASGHPGFASNQQGIALAMVMRRHTDILCILPTGGGKSLLFTAPPLIEGKLTTVVIFPFLSLLDDMLKKYETKPGLCARLFILISLNLLL